MERKNINTGLKQIKVWNNAVDLLSIKTNENMIMKFESLKFIGIALLTLILIQCKPKNKTDNVADNIVLKVGNIEITKYEFDKNKKRYYDPNSGKSYMEWLDEFINEAYFLADAFDNKFDTVATINKNLDIVACSMVGRVGGYLWNKVEEPKLVFSDSEIEKIYKKRDKVFFLEYLSFTDEKAIAMLLKNDTVIKTATDFNRLIDICRPNNSVIIKNGAFLYPFDELEPVKDIIFGLNQGDVTPLIRVYDKIVAIHLLKTENTKQQPFTFEKDQIKRVLREIKTTQLTDKKRIEIFNKAHIIINEKLEDTVFKIINDTQYDFCKNTLTDTLMRYTLENQPKYLLIKDFVYYYRNNPFLYFVEEKQMLRNILYDFVEEQYLFTEAENLGVTKETGYILDKKNYKNKLILGYYYRNKFYNNVNVSDDELQVYYNDNKQNFTGANSCNVSVFTFNDKQSATKNLGYLYSKISTGKFKDISDTTIVKGLISYKRDIKIDKDNKIYPQELTRDIFNAPLNQLEGPIDYNNVCILFVKTKQEGKKIKPFEEIKEEIRNIITDDKADVLKKQKIKELKEKYPVSINKI
ncbi:MAG: peptidyl-prolyl cis-trans isomerase [Bacteroidales bacterium]|nr:peptidyl-prolyl cis-trans isomerase [Bacteroidales bacterium]